MEKPRDLSQVQDVELFVEQHPDQLIILDEIQRVPNIFTPLRGLVDERARGGFDTGQFLFLGSASLDLLGQTGESLAGRVAYIELSGITQLELARAQMSETTSTDLWLRGGFPKSTLALDEETSLQWREDLIRTYLERDVPQFGFRAPAETLRRLWTMLAHHQGSLLNASALSKGLVISNKKVTEYLDILTGLLLVRRLQPWYANVGKRLIKLTKTYIRDSGLLHALLGLETIDDLLGHPIVGHSWEGFVIKNIIMCNGARRMRPYFYHTSAGAEIDLILARSEKPEIAIEIKRASNPKVSKGFHSACDDLNIKHRYVVYPGHETYRINNEIWAIPAKDLMHTLKTRSDYSFGV